MLLKPLLASWVLMVVCLGNYVSAQVNTAHSYAFGDSLTDNDLLFYLFENDPILYGSDPFEAFHFKASLPGDQLTNFAVLGSTTADVKAQVKDYLIQRFSGEIPRATLVSLQAGGNDIIFNLELLASAAPGESAEADALVRQIKRDYRQAFLALYLLEDADMVLWTVPDVTSIPLVQAQGIPDAALANVRAHIDRINRSIKLLARLRHVALIDLYTLNRSYATDPPVIQDTPLLPPPIFGFRNAVFADPIHPTAVGNALIANEMIRAANRRFRDNIPSYSEQELAVLAGFED